MTTAASQPSRTRRWLLAFRTLWSVVGVTLLLLVVAEVILRAVYARREGVQLARLQRKTALADAEWLPELFAEQNAAQHARSAPFLYWRTSPYEGRLLRVDHGGLRRTVNQPATDDTAAEAPRPLRVVCMGGSSVWGWLARDEHTLPSELARQIEAAKLGPCDVVNLAQIGHVTTQEVIALLQELQQSRAPEVVVMCHGYNDLLSALQNRRAGAAQHQAERDAEFHVQPGGALRLLVERSAIAQAARHLGGIARRDTKAASLDETQLVALADGVAACYAANLQAVFALADRAPFEVLVCFQPMVFSKRVLTDEERTYVAEKRQLAELHDAVIARLRESPACRDERFHDLGDVFADSAAPRFLDECHLTEAANAEVAATIFEHLRPQLAKRRAATNPP